MLYSSSWWLLYCSSDVHTRYITPCSTHFRLLCTCSESNPFSSDQLLHLAHASSKVLISLQLPSPYSHFFTYMYHHTIVISFSHYQTTDSILAMKEVHVYISCLTESQPTTLVTINPKERKEVSGEQLFSTSLMYGHALTCDNVPLIGLFLIIIGTY